MSDPLREASARLKAAGVEFPRMEARLLLAHALDARAEDIIADSVTPDTHALAKFESSIARRIAHEPIAYITGTREFWSMRFHVDRNVLIPRPESETLIEEALRRFPDKQAQLNVLDLGTGSGCLLLAFLSERPNAHGVGIDISAGAAACAERNARAHGLETRTRIVTGDWLELSGTFDVIFSNPPYIETADLASLAPDVRDFEPNLALDGGADGLTAYRGLATVLPCLMHRETRTFVELGKGQGEAVQRIFEAGGLDVEGLVNDLQYIPRCLVAAAGVKAPQVKRKKDMEKETRSG